MVIASERGIFLGLAPGGANRVTAMLQVLNANVTQHMIRTGYPDLTSVALRFFNSPLRRIGFSLNGGPTRSE